MRSCSSTWVEPRAASNEGIEAVQVSVQCLWILATVEVSGDRQAGLSFRRPDKIQDLLIAIERFPGPVLGDLGEESVLDGVPFGSAGGVVGNGESQPERVCQLRLEFGLPGEASSTIAAAGVAEDEELVGARITD